MCGVCQELKFNFIQWLMVFIHMDKCVSQNHLLNRPSFSLSFVKLFYHISSNYYFA